ncbi:FluC/FEX family fluoride channel [Streptomyces brasiliensis]|uniref:Fluoride-specific ion channel n=1 Tax=Streptomyces brasiliensis TaxID=1954 RepID=A0A917NVF6_9ACTN|nr:CrcB family protein [Streptomyces brasiliensis]GGJ28847.1 hypothetical protein GCM10010121_045190 [Streptomyces brasiliensis]
MAGCAAIGVFMTISSGIEHPYPLLPPSFGTGVLGGFTTFSTYTVAVTRRVIARSRLLAGPP